MTIKNVKRVQLRGHIQEFFLDRQREISIASPSFSQPNRSLSQLDDVMFDGGYYKIDEPVFRQFSIICGFFQHDCLETDAEYPKVKDLGTISVSSQVVGESTFEIIHSFTDPFGTNILQLWEVYRDFIVFWNDMSEIRKNYSQNLE